MANKVLSPTAWTRRLQVTTSVYSVVTTIGTALVLGYITPELLLARTDIAPSDIDGFLVGFRITGIAFLLLNAVGIAALWDKAWVFWTILATDLFQGIGFFFVDWPGTGLRGLGILGTYLTDVGGGILGLVLLGFALRYRTAWAYQRH
ncbi:hypothetical protein [Nocardia sp. NPDC052566]|uniref:hypothetical protein n=1 Tax=Nocardia sp. NPDC052566 TaxID=3364330 RepID=UPI0037CA9477